MSDRELLTASRMSALLDCPRRHYWRYETGLQRQSDSKALSFGSAWHRAMECRNKGGEYEAALSAAIADKTDLDEYDVATIAGLLIGYYEKWHDDPFTITAPEHEFRIAIDGSRTFDAAGKIDGIGNKEGRVGMMEYKTTGDSIDDASDYWLRLRANPQIIQYLVAAFELGYNPEFVFYDVTRKPSIQPKMVADLDENGCKIVVDAAGNRVFKKDGSPRESADTEKGYIVKCHLETPEEFGARLALDCRERPDFYFARREVPILQDDIDEFLQNRIEIGKMILSFRQAQKRTRLPHQAWPKHLHGRVCDGCEFKSFCLQNIVPDLAMPPAGFVVGPIHRELSAV